ncbi:unnamed protein product [Spirodela intermedia]|uniref:Uncharacterized protein n=1 Tax=Spirodela intermedia TaxID=51605 RepID=A0A7I8IU05_SPIIN|nr:unnamed protein product [Spirodela intermedia]CAA6661466.1 unnamed protein product [Spirodela intermedia]
MRWCPTGHQGKGKRRKSEIHRFGNGLNYFDSAVNRVDKWPEESQIKFIDSRSWTVEDFCIPFGFQMQTNDHLFAGCGLFHFSLDGRRILIGDCALFQAGNSPPFIGIIRWFSPGKQDQLKLGVNRLYRPSEVKLAKGILLEAAPNEVFYSFHKDEISAELLLHPCKVAFLRKGVELPQWISSFVCRRVYDSTNKCLWWLTDQDYIDDQQEEIAKLLGKTQVEMHAAVQPGGRSPKQLNGPAQQPKPGTDSVQNNNASLPSQVKGKKRAEKGDQASDSIKRERLLKADDGDSNSFKVESTLKAEIEKITDKGALINVDAVEKLVQLMQVDKGERKIDLAGRILLADVIAATDKNDCLGRFVQLRGVPLLDDWLQEAHKRKNGDGTTPKECEKSVDELLLALLHALDKLPVNLEALQTSQVGKSVNHLRSHKNSEIQKKARSLVDTWKKRVDVEMTKLEMTKLNDAKSTGTNQAASWPGKPGFSEVSYGGNKRSGSSEASLKSPVAQSSTCKSLPVKASHGDSVMKLNSGQSASVKLPSTLATSLSIGTKDSQSKAGGSSWTAELPLTAIEEKSSGSSQSQNNSQSCSSDHGKQGSAWKEDAKSSTSGSTHANKVSGGTSRQRKASNGLVGTGSSGAQKDSSLSKPSPLSRNLQLEKVPQHGLPGERTGDAPSADHGNNQRLIVRLPNPGRSPARSTSGGCFEDSSQTSTWSSSPVAAEKVGHINQRTKLKNDDCRASVTTDVNAESWHSNDLKGADGVDGADKSTTAVRDEKHMSTDKSGKAADAFKPTSLSESKPVKTFDTLSPINALIESCVKYSEASASSGGDDSGMNLLASVAAGEISKSNLLSPSGPPDPCTTNKVKSTVSSGGALTNVSEYPEDCTDDDSEKHEPKIVPNSCDDSQSIQSPQESRATIDNRAQHLGSVDIPCKNAESISKAESKVNAVEVQGRVPFTTLSEDVKGVLAEDDSPKQLRRKRKASSPVTDGLQDSKHKAGSPTSDESKHADCVRESTISSSIQAGDGSDLNCSARISNCEESVEIASSSPPGKQDVADGVLHDATTPTGQQLPSDMAVSSNSFSINSINATLVSSTNAGLEAEDEGKKEKSDSLVLKSQMDQTDTEKKVLGSLAAPTADDRTGSLTPSTDDDSDDNYKEVSHPCSTSANHEEPSIASSAHTEECTKSLNSGYEVDLVREEVACSTEVSSAVASPVQDTSTKLDFDLNEGFSVDEATTAEPVASAALESSSSVHLMSLQPFTMSLISNTSPVPITVAAPAKGPFVPPETLLKSKGEPGWRGSAATSAFRPAEPGRFGTICLVRPTLHHRMPLLLVDNRGYGRLSSGGFSQEAVSESRVMCNRDAQVRKSSGVLDLDLNRVDESTENGQSASTSQRLDVPLPRMRSSPGGFPNSGANMLRDFDLNDGPGVDEAGADQVPRGQLSMGNSIPFLPTLRLNNNELGNLSTWFPPGNSYPAVAMPSFLPERVDQQPYSIVAAPGGQRILSSAAGGFPFGSSFPLASTSYSMGSTPMWTLQLSVPGSQAFVEEQSRLYQTAGRALKRKEPEGGWDGERFTCK